MMEMFSNSTVWAALGAIIIANILLSGDNAIVIAMAARSLAPEQQKKAIFWGSAAAIVLRIVLTVFAVYLLTVPFLKIIGALALIYIGVDLMKSGEEGDEEEIKSHASMGAAIRTILVADLVMSLDNVVAVAAAADKAPEAYRWPLLIIGLALSIPLIIVGSSLLVKIIDKFPVIVTLGAALLGWLAGSLVVTDPAVSAWFQANIANAEMLAGGFGALLVVGLGMYLVKKAKAH
jgi:YjbE family integral membrane protein